MNTAHNLQWDGKQLLFEGSNCLIYRYDGGDAPVILKVLKAEYPTPRQLMHLNNEYEITHALAAGSVRRVLQRTQVDGRDALVLEYFEGIPLADTNSNNLEDLLILSIAVAEALDGLHRQHVIHKDLNSNNILINPLRHEVRLIDFGISSRIDTKISLATSTLEGTLAYISPEQTGRMNRIVDYRSDLYSLGVTLFELFCGSLPFIAEDMLEMVHCHIAKRPPAPETVNPELPSVLSEILLKLLAKNAEDRYQSASGLAADLRTCLQQWRAKQRIEPFALASEDHLGSFRIPQKLYGRAGEIRLLLEAFERVAAGRREMLLISGYSGVGKSALVNEIHQPMTVSHGYFIGGKYDQYQRSIPYSAISRAFGEFCAYLLSESQTVLEMWKNEIISTLGGQGQIITEVIPELEQVIGEQPKVPPASSAEEAQHRFNRVFRAFIKILGQRDHPLILFIDDLQWADTASIQLLEALMEDDSIRYFFLLGAYRDNEVDASHPLMRTLENLRKQQIAVHDIHLENLSQNDVTHLLEETLHHPKGLHELTDLIYSKTAGNAFFTTEFLKSLYKEELLKFYFKAKRWEWDIELIQRKDITGNVVELMAGKIEQLPDTAREILMLAACIGNRFDLQTLALVKGEAERTVLKQLWPVVEEGLLVPLDDNYKLIHSLLADADAVLHNTAFAFLHDRVQQAAYSLIDDAEKMPVHLEIGRLLLSDTKDEDLDERIFSIVAHLNQGLELITAQAERQRLAELNLLAGRKAMNALAYASAHELLQAGIQALFDSADKANENAWTVHFELAFTLYNRMALCEYRTGKFELAAEHFRVLMDKARSPRQISKVFGEAVYLYTTMNQYMSAIALAREGLARLGMDFPQTITREIIGEELKQAMQSLGDRQVMDLLDMPKMSEEDKIAPFGILHMAIPSSWLAMPPGFAWCSLQMVKLSHRHGNLTTSAFGYSIYALMLCGEPQQYTLGYQYGCLAIELNQRYPSLFVRGTIHFFFNNFILHWSQHKNLNPPLRRIAHQGCSESGAYVYGVYNTIFSFYQSFFADQPLSDMLTEYRGYLPFVERVNDRDVYGVLRLLLQLGNNLQGLSAGALSLDGPDFDEAAYLDELHEREYGNGLCFYFLSKQVLYFTAENYREALAASESLEPHYVFLFGLYHQTLFHFYRALSITHLYSEMTAEEQQHWRSVLDADIEKLRLWQDNCPDNFAAQYLLIKAEIARLDGADLKSTVLLYEQAIQAAGSDGAQVWAYAALANECCARFWLAHDLANAAVHYLREAHYLYRLWGAKTKVQTLESRYSKWLQGASVAVGSTLQTRTKTQTSMDTANIEGIHTLDIYAVVQASNLLAEEIVLEQLLDKLMRILVENSGAQRGVLLLEERGQLLIQAANEEENDKILVLQGLPAVESQSLPQRIINYVERTHQAVVLENAALTGAYISDPYIKCKRIKSVLCVPIVQQNRLTGILYLENNLIIGTFTPDRLEVINLLSAQAAISLENALLYRTMESKVEERTAQLAQANVEINTLNQRLTVENQRMGAELDVAKQLQQMVLPRDQELQRIGSLEIAAFMQPADEVGGDYYDVLEYDDHIKISIGDVTGHGLESGVVMLMVQMGIRTLLSTGCNQPQQCLQALNHALHENLLRMGSDKNLTLCLLDYHDGKLEISGQHEDILIMRRNGQLEYLDTADLGIFVGLLPDIYEYIDSREIILEPGDGIVLFTDGVTEAKNAQKQFYGIERLSEIVTEYWSYSPHIVQQAVVEDLKAHLGTTALVDDITLLVLKRV